MKIMFVCTGNICRSAMAEWLLKKKLVDQNKKGIEVSSSGIYAMKNDVSPQEAIEVMDEYSVNLRNHRATNTSLSNIKQNDLILCMTTSHKQTLQHQYPEQKDHIYTLKEYVGDTQMEIKDPWGYNIVTYRYCAAQIDECLNKLIEKIDGQTN